VPTTTGGWGVKTRWAVEDGCALGRIARQAFVARPGPGMPMRILKKRLDDRHPGGL